VNAEAFKQLSQELREEAIAETDNKCEPFGFIDGQRDCRDKGIAKSGQSPQYYRGYGVEYALEQQRTARSRENEPV
jgi:hypothetical protein